MVVRDEGAGILRFYNPEGDFKPTMDDLQHWWNVYQEITKSSEPFLERYTGHLSRLNGLVTGSGALLEGNLFYHHHAKELGCRPDGSRLHKRRIYCAYVSAGTELLEIGFNAGHSALLALTANPRLRYLGIDIGIHPYVGPCFEYLKGVFGDRIELILGPSSRMLADLVSKPARPWNRFHIDGSHSTEDAYNDLMSAAELAGLNGILLLDDMQAKSVRAACNLLLLEGRLAVQSVLPDFECREQVMLRII